MGIGRNEDGTKSRFSHSLLQGFDRPTAAPPFSPIPSPYGAGMPLPSSLSSPLSTTSLPQSGTPTGFQPYRPSLSMPPQPIPYHPGLLPPSYASLSHEADPVYQAQMARYMAAMSRGVGVPSIPSYPAGYPLHPSLLPPGSVSPAFYSGGQAEMALLHDQLRAEEMRRMGELEAELRQSKSGVSSPTHRPPSSGEALHRLSRIASQPGEPFKPGKRPLGPGGPIPTGLKLPTKPLDFSELRGTAARPLMVSTPSPPCSPPLPSPPSVSRCMPYVPKPRDRSRAALTATSTPKKLFVRPFEDDYSVSPIAAPGEGEVEVMGELKVVRPESEIALEELSSQKEEQEDSDYESMSSDSSIKKEGDNKGMVCPTSGHVLTDEECDKKDVVVFREPESELPSQQKDKLKYLRYFRLVTHRKKNDIEIQKLEKRKSRLRERSPSPPPVEDDFLGRSASPTLPLPSVPPHLNKLPESHAKVMYLSAIGLCRNTEEQKLNHEQVWSAVLEDRLTRDRESTVNKFFVRLRSITEQDQGVKRSWNGVDVEEVLPSGLRTPLNIPSCEALSRLQEGNEGRVSLPSSVEINLCSLQPIAQPSLLVQEVKQEPTMFSSAAPPAHLQHHGLPRNLSPFTRASDSVVEPEDLSQPAKRRKPNSPIPWQGIDAITEAYKKFRTGGPQCFFLLCPSTVCQGWKDVPSL